MSSGEELLAEGARDSVEVAPRFGISVLLTSITNVAISVLGVVTGLLLARLLGPDGRGVLAAVQLWPFVIATVAVVGLPEALVYFCARDRKQAGTYLVSAVSLALMLSTAFAIAGYLLMPLLLAQQPGPTVELARRFLLVLPINATLGMLLHPLRGRGDFVAWNILRLIPTFAWLALLIGATLLAIREPSTIAMAQLSMFTLLIIPMGLIVARRLPRPFKANVGHWKPMLVYGAPSMLATLPQMLNLRLDQMVMAAFLPSHSLGLYIVAVAWAGATQPLLSAIGSALLPSVASESGLEERRSALVGGVQLAVVAAIILCIFLLVITPVLLPLLLGPAFRNAVPAAMLLVIAGSILGLNLVMEEGARGLGFPKIVFWAELTGAGATLLALYVFLRPLGEVGAAVASLLGYLGASVVLVRSLSHTTEVPARSLLRPAFREFFQRARAVLKRGEP